jgi:hypothetical protein
MNLLGIAYLLLAGISLIALIAGTVLVMIEIGRRFAVLVNRFRTSRGVNQVDYRLNPLVDLGDQLEELKTQPDDFDTRSIKGTALSFAEIKAAAASGDWGRAAPGLLIICGVGGLIFFGALAAADYLDAMPLGLVVVAIAGIWVIQMLIKFFRA